MSCNRNAKYTTQQLQVATQIAWGGANAADHCLRPGCDAALIDDGERCGRGHSQHPGEYARDVLAACRAWKWGEELLDDADSLFFTLEGHAPQSIVRARCAHAREVAESLDDEDLVAALTNELADFQWKVGTVAWYSDDQTGTRGLPQEPLVIKEILGDVCYIRGADGQGRAMTLGLLESFPLRPANPDEPMPLLTTTVEGEEVDIRCAYKSGERMSYWYMAPITREEMEVHDYPTDWASFDIRELAAKFDQHAVAYPPDRMQHAEIVRLAAETGVPLGGDPPSPHRLPFREWILKHGVEVGTPDLPGPGGDRVREIMSLAQALRKTLKVAGMNIFVECRTEEDDDWEGVMLELSPWDIENMPAGLADRIRGLSTIAHGPDDTDGDHFQYYLPPTSARELLGELKTDAAPPDTPLIADLPAGHPFAGAPIIFAYTRQQALADRVLYDVSSMAKEANFRIPVAITASVKEMIEDIPEERGWEDVNGRQWDVLYMASQAARQGASTGEVHFQLILTRPGQDFDIEEVDDRYYDDKLVTLKMSIGAHGPTDPRPCITIMLPTED